jgi:hypothetical protein
MLVAAARLGMGPGGGDLPVGCKHAGLLVPLIQVQAYQSCLLMLLLQGDFVRDAKLRSSSPSGGNSPTTPASPTPGLAGEPASDGSPAAAAGAGGGSSLKSLATMPKGGPGGNF